MASPALSFPPYLFASCASHAGCVWQRVLLCTLCCWWLSLRCLFIVTNQNIWALCWWSPYCGDLARLWSRRASTVSDICGIRHQFCSNMMCVSMMYVFCVDSSAWYAVRWGQRTSGLHLHHLPLVAGHRHLHSISLVQPADEGKTVSLQRWSVNQDDWEFSRSMNLPEPANRLFWAAGPWAHWNYWHCLNTLWKSLRSTILEWNRGPTNICTTCSVYISQSWLPCTLS